MSSRASDNVPVASRWLWWLILLLLAAVLIALIVHLARSPQVTAVELTEQDILNMPPGAWDDPNLIIYGRVKSIDRIAVTSNSNERWLYLFRKPFGWQADCTFEAERFLREELPAKTFQAYDSWHRDQQFTLTEGAEGYYFFWSGVMSGKRYIFLLGAKFVPARFSHIVEAKLKQQKELSDVIRRRLSFSISLPKDEFEVGEPITLKLTWTNRGAGAITLASPIQIWNGDVPYVRAGELIAQTEGGQPVPFVHVAPWQIIELLSGPSPPTLAPGGNFESTLDAAYYFRFDTPGRYRLWARFAMGPGLRLAQATEPGERIYTNEELKTSHALVARMESQPVTFTIVPRRQKGEEK